MALIDEASTAARLEGYSWDEINDHVEDSTQQALAEGYTQPEVDAHLGYQDPTPFKAGLAATASQDQTEPLPDPPKLATGLPDLSKPLELPEGLPQTYADALNAGHVKGPDDFAQHYAEATGSSPEAAQHLAASLLHPEELTDHAIALTAANGSSLDLDNLSAARANLLDVWAQSGLTPQEALATKDPVLLEELTRPREPGLPTVAEMAEIEKANSDMIGGLLGGAANWIYKNILDGSEMWKEQEEHDKAISELVKKNREEGKPPLAGAADLLSKSPVGTAFGLGLAGEGVGGMRTLLQHATENPGKIANDVKVTIGGKEGKGATLEEAHAEATKPQYTLEHQPSEEAPGNHSILDEHGNPVGYVDITKEGTSARIEMIHTDEPLGASGVRALLRQFREQNPEVTSLTGNRVSGAREGGRFEGEAEHPVEVKLPPAKPDLTGPADGAKLEINGKEYHANEGESLKDFYERAQDEHGKAAIREAVDALGKARVDKVIDVIQPPQLKEEIRPLVRRVDDELNRLRTNAQVDAEKMWQKVKELNPEWLDKSFQEKVHNSVEQRLVDPAHVHDEQVQKFLDAVKPITDRQTELANAIKAKTEGLEIDEVKGIRSVDEGYSHRVVKDGIGDRSPLDPDLQRDAITGARPRSLSKKADSVQQQRQFTMWHADGGTPEPAKGMVRWWHGGKFDKPGSMPYIARDRAMAEGYAKGEGKKLHYVDLPANHPEILAHPDFPTFQASEEVSKGIKPYAEKAPPSRTWNPDKERKLGEQEVNPIDGKTYTLQHATTAEVEKNTGIQYHKNFIANTADNVLKLERINRNLDFLGGLAKELEDMGLIVRDVPNKVQNIPDGFKRVDLPQLRGHANAKIADVLNDFWGGNKSDLQKWGEMASRFIMNSLFISPAVHIGNVGAHWFIGRGLDWANPMGYYRLARYGAQAIYQVATKGEKYLQLLEHGSGLQFLSTQSEVNNFYSTMMSKLFHEQMADKNTWGSYAKTLGFNAVSDMVKTELKWSRQALWFANDVFLMQRTLELEAKGFSIQEAIYRAEKDIPNYRVPSAVMGSHVLSQVMQSPLSMNFGRYRYGQIRAMALNVKDLVAPEAGQFTYRGNMDRLDALAKLSMMYGVTAYLQPAVDTFLQQQFNDKNWHMKGFGPFSLINSVKGLFQGEKEWGAAMSSFFTWGKALDVADMVKSNKDFFGRPIINDKMTTLGKITHGAEAVASQFYPTQLAMQMTKPGGVAKSLGALAGLDYKKPYVKPDWVQRMEQAQAAAQERNDPIEGWLRDHLAELGINTEAPAAAGGGGGGGSSGGGRGSSSSGEPRVSWPSYTGAAAAPGASTGPRQRSAGGGGTTPVYDNGIVARGSTRSSSGSRGGGRASYPRGRYYRGGARRRAR